MTINGGDEFNPDDLYDQFPDGASAGFGPAQGFNRFVRLNDPTLFTEEAREDPVERMLNGSEVASGGAGADGTALDGVIQGTGGLILVGAGDLALNALNEDCGGNLIETGEREALCDLIERAAREAGLPESDEDITEAWREW